MSPETTLRPHTVVAQSYELQRMIGAGAMGVVYEATDLVLLRRVAIKVHEIGRSDRAARLWREARAMARLSDPNVVAIHEVGIDGSRGFIAMELVEGTNAREWVFITRPTWQGVIDVYRQAGRGLAAAHAVGIIHRDFKPDNLLVRVDGRAKVADFGLAAAPAQHLTVSQPSFAVDDATTRTGATMGTPAYMAPEVLRGEPADARSDQYAFCVAVHEALHGARPGFPPPARHAIDAMDVPTWIDGVLARGLSYDPNLRYADMAQLVAALDPEPRRRRRSALLIAATLLLGGAPLVWTGGWLAAPEAEVPCLTAGASMDPTWSEATKTDLEQTFAARPSSLSTATMAVVGPGFDAWADRWREAAHESCEATYVVRQQSMARLDERNDCLERMRRRFAAAIAVVRDGDVEAMTRAADVVASLPEVAMCARTDAALERDEVGPDCREVHEQRLAALDVAAADVAAGHNAGARKALDTLIMDLEADGFTHALAEAHRLRGDASLALGFRDEAIADLDDAVALALGAGNRDAIATAMSSLARALGRTSGGSDEALRVLAAARALAEDLEWSESRNLGLHLVELEIAFYAERYADAQRVAAVLLADAGLDDAREIRVRSLRATTFERQTRFDDALAAHDETLAFVEGLRGVDHPDVAGVLTNRAPTLAALNRYDEELASLQRALEIRMATDGAEAPVVGEIHRQIGGVELRRLHHDAAVVHYERAIVIHRAANDDTGLSLALANLTTVYEDLQQYAVTGPLHDEAIAAGERAFGPRSLQVARMLANRGVARFHADELAQGAAELERALAILIAGLPAGDPAIATARISLSRFLARLGRGDEAVALFDTGRRAIQEKYPRDHARAVILAYNHAALLDLAGRADEALDAWRAMHALSERSLAVDQPLRVEMLADYGLRLLEAGLHGEARPILESAHEQSTRLGDDGERTAAVAQGLSRTRRRR